MKDLIPYIIFPGNCKEALNFYKECLNGEISLLRDHTDSPIDVAKEHEHLIFDSEFRADNMLFKSSDDLPGYEISVGRNFALFVTFSEEEEQKNVYSKLCESGKALMPLPDTPGTSKFGMLTDKFGIQWMLVYEHK